MFGSVGGSFAELVNEHLDAAKLFGSFISEITLLGGFPGGRPDRRRHAASDEGAAGRLRDLIGIDEYIRTAVDLAPTARIDTRITILDWPPVPGRYEQRLRPVAAAATPAASG
jgi:hypothetical protein